MGNESYCHSKKDRVFVRAQQQVEPRPSEPAPGAEGFQARHLEDDYNHPR